MLAIIHGREAGVRHTCAFLGGRQKLALAIESSCRFLQSTLQQSHHRGFFIIQRVAICSRCFSGFGGLIPASIFASVPAATPQQGSPATTMGFVVQASHFGQLIGPPIVAAVATAAGGWQLSVLVLVPAALIALAGALALRASH